MKINFIGQGTDINCTKSVGEIIASSLQSKDFHKFIGFSAYARLSGINYLKKHLIVAKQHFKEIEFFVGIDKKGTSKEALQSILDLDICLHVFYNDSFIFHPKIYFFQGENHNRIIVGSCNLTSHGLFHNIEGSLLLDFHNTDFSSVKLTNQFSSFYKDILEKFPKNAVKCDNELIIRLVNEGKLLSETEIRKKNSEEDIGEEDITENETDDLFLSNDTNAIPDEEIIPFQGKEKDNRSMEFETRIRNFKFTPNYIEK